MKPLDPRLLRRSRPVRVFLGVAVTLGCLAGVAVVAQAWLLADLVARVVDGAGSPQVAGVTALLALVVAGRGLLAWAQATAGARAASAVKAGLRHDLVRHVLDPGGATAHRSSARVAGLVGGGIDALDGYVARFLPQVVVTAVVPLGVLATLLVVDPLSFLVVVLTLPLVVAFLVLVGMVTRDHLDQRWAELQRLGRQFSDVLAGLPVLTGFGRDAGRGVAAVGQRHRRATVASLRTAFLSSLVLELFSTLSVALVAVSAGLRLVSGDLDLRTGLLVIVLAPEAYLPLRRLGAQFHDSQQGLAVADEVLDLLADAEATSGRRPAPRRPAAITVDGLEVVHLGRDRPALRLAHAEIEPGEVVAVTGASGAGKSTLLSVLLRFAAPTRGTVRVGGHDLADLDVESWRQGLAWVPQTPQLLAGTIADNVRVGAEDATDADVRRALDDAGADDLALDRQVGESGTQLSAGERRRVAIARALVRVRVGGAWLVLLDEPTAGLDAAREATVLQTLRALDVTALVVAHRPDTVAAASRELRLDAREVVSVR